MFHLPFPIHLMRQVQQQQAGLAHTVPALPTSRDRVRSPPSNAHLPQVAWSPTVTVPGSRPNTAGSGLLRPGSALQAAGSTQHLYEDILLSASALGGMGASGLLPPGELQSRTAELHFKVDELEKDLRWVLCTHQCQEAGLRLPHNHASSLAVVLNCRLQAAWGAAKPHAQHV